MNSLSIFLVFPILPQRLFLHDQFDGAMSMILSASEAPVPLLIDDDVCLAITLNITYLWSQSPLHRASQSSRRGSLHLRPN